MVDSSSPPETSSLPARPPSPHSDREGGSPPRKRPRTKAPPPAASDGTTATATNTAPQANVLQPALGEIETEQTHRFPIQPLDRFKGASASIKRPREVAHFSFDDNHEYVYDESGLNYYVPPPMGADLKEGFDTFRHHEDKEDAHLDAMFRALIDTEKNKGSSARVEVEFMTWRGMMTKVC